MTEDIMAGNRWENLDFDRPRRPEGLPADAPLAARSAADRDARASPTPCAHEGTLSGPAACREEQLPVVVVQAQGAYLLRNYQAAVDHLDAPLRQDPELAGGQRLMGLALARLNREAEAVDRLQQAVAQSASDWLARASLSSLLLRTPSLATDRRPVVALLEEAVTAAPRSSRAAVRELLGAAHWRSSQELLGEGHPREAERQFARAGEEFARAANESMSARPHLTARLSAVLVGQAVAFIAAGAPEAAQRLFSRTPVPRTPSADPLCRFAAGLYELCDELAPVSAEERAPAVEALRQVVLQTRLEVGFYDGRGSVCLAWWSQPGRQERQGV
jgi:tetratricopeptide (TPR) repeat protein